MPIRRSIRPLVPRQSPSVIGIEKLLLDPSLRWAASWCRHCSRREARTLGTYCSPSAEHIPPRSGWGARFILATFHLPSGPCDIQPRTSASPPRGSGYVGWEVALGVTRHIREGADSYTAPHTHCLPLPDPFGRRNRDAAGDRCTSGNMAMNPIAQYFYPHGK